MTLPLLYFSVFLVSASAVDTDILESASNSSYCNLTKAAETQACGNVNPQTIPFTVCREKKFGEFPWMVAIAKLDHYDFICGGSLIHPQVVLTAAHCVNNEGTLHVRVGEWDRTNAERPYPHQYRTVKTTVIHPDFKPGALHNDLALLFLNAAVWPMQHPAKHIDIICLPESTDYDGERCVVFGWGNGLFELGDFKKRKSTIVKASTCEEGLRKTPLGDSFQLHESFTCAGYDNYVGGSPLMCSINQTRYYQAGIASWNIRTDGEVNSVFTKVGIYTDWIHQQMRVEGRLDPEITEHKYSQTSFK